MTEKIIEILKENETLTECKQYFLVKRKDYQKVANEIEAAINYTRCCTELFCLDNTDADGLTLHKRYKFINEDETNSLIIDDYGGNKAYLSNRFVKVIK